MANLLEIRDMLLEQTGKDIFQPHPHLEGIIDEIIAAADYGDITDYANLLEEIKSFCQDQLRVHYYGDDDEE